MSEVSTLATGLRFPEGPIAMPHPYCTNIRFGGTNLRTAHGTLSGVGRLVTIPWARPGLVLH